MSSSASLYRRHRPRTFDDVIGQEHVVRTLKNAVDQDNVHHAYLFVGSRGTGKTSMAKILASALNATGGPSSSFDGDDPAAVAIAQGSSLDVVEMDAASHNGVDDIRELIDSVALAPTTGGWKVYILDEAHMITTAGWNAFLKTLEEPPPNTVFVLATTEANKVLPTVADRCHRFDFRRPTVEQLSQALRRAADAEKIEIGDDAVAMIARSATGSFRDALGTLEQLVTYGGTKVAAEDVQAVLGVADFELLIATADAIAAGDRRGVLLAISELADSGRDMTAFAREFAAHIRNLLVTRTLEEVPPSVGLTDNQSALLLEQSKKWTPERTAHTLDLLSSTIQQSRGGGDPRLLLELALFKAARPEDDSDPGALMARIEALESRPAGAPAAAAAAGAPPVAARPAPVKPVAAAPDKPVDEPPAPAPPSPEDPIIAGDPGPETESSAAPEPEPVAAPEPAAAPEPTDAPSVEIVASAWDSIVGTVMSESPSLAAALENSKPHLVEGSSLTIAVPESASFQRKQLEQPDKRDLVAKHIAQATGFTFKVKAESIPDEVFNPELSDGGEPQRLDPHELADALKAEFDATEITGRAK
jgi:DNA polymerase-3 subunit gamma/tau